MKRFVLLLIAVALLLCSCSGLSDEQQKVFEALQKDYPDSQITRSSNDFRIISENVDYKNLPTESLEDLACRITYTDMQQFLDSMDILNYVIFVGEKTGETKQLIPINSETGNVSGLFYTNSKLKVKKVYYGDLSAGDIITVKEFYAVFGGEQKKLVTYENIVADGEYLLVAHRQPYESLYGEDHYYSLMQEGIIKLDIFKDTDESIQSELYQKYIINNDTAIDKEKEMDKINQYFAQSNQTATDAQISKIGGLIEKYSN